MRRLCAAFVVAALFAGCGDEGDTVDPESTGTTASEELPAEEFKARFAEVDGAVSAAFDTYFSTAPPNAGGSQALSRQSRDALAEAVELEQAAVSELASMTPPADAQQAVDRLAGEAGAQAQALTEVASTEDVTYAEVEEILSSTSVDTALSELERLGYYDGGGQGL